jgi:hypothetical protein
MRLDEIRKKERSVLRCSQSNLMPQHLKIEEERMDALARRAFLEGLLGSKTITTKTNLYSIIEAIQEEEDDASPETAAFVVPVVSHLLSTGRIRLPISSELGEDYSIAGILET